MALISLNTAAHLTGVSKRTLWRRIAAGHLRGEKLPNPHGRTLIPLAAIAADIGLALGDEETTVIQQADAGVAAAQQELALIFLQAGRPDRARPWLDLAAEQGCADALFCLGGGADRGAHDRPHGRPGPDPAGRRRWPSPGPGGHGGFTGAAGTLNLAALGC